MGGRVGVGFRPFKPQPVLLRILNFCIKLIKILYMYIDCSCLIEFFKLRDLSSILSLFFDNELRPKCDQCSRPCGFRQKDFSCFSYVTKPCQSRDRPRIGSLSGPKSGDWRRYETIKMSDRRQTSPNFIWPIGHNTIHGEMEVWL